MRPPTSKLHVVVEDNAVAVTRVVENIRVVNATAPHPQHVHAPVRDTPYQIGMRLRE